jgi:hypothetical protein
LTSFDEFISEVEAEAAAEGPDAVAELAALRAHFAAERQHGDRDSASADTDGQPASA